MKNKIYTSIIFLLLVPSIAFSASFSDQIETTFEQQGDQIQYDTENLADNRWSLVDEECLPEMNVAQSFNNMSNYYSQALDSLKDQFLNGVTSQATNAAGQIIDSAGNVIEGALPSVDFFSMDSDMDLLAVALTTQKCMELLTGSLGSSSPILEQISGKTEQCISEATKDSIKCDTESHRGSWSGAGTGCEVDVSGFLGRSVCSFSRMTEVLGEAFENCFSEQKSSTRDFIETTLADGVARAQQDFELQHMKCELDKQNYETTYQEIIGDGFTTVVGDNGLNVIKTNESDNNMIDDMQSRMEALNQCYNKAKEIYTINTNGFSRKQAIAYRISLKSWCDDIFVYGDKCPISTIDSPDDNIKVNVPNCRWSKKIARYSPEQLESLLGTSNGFYRSLSRITIWDECNYILSTKKAISELNPPIVELERGFSDPYLNEGRLPSFPVIDGIEKANRFYMFLQRFVNVREKSYSYGGPDSNYTPYNDLVLENAFLELKTNKAMSEICEHWLDRSTSYSNNRIINDYDKRTKFNYANGERKSEVTKDALNSFEKNSNKYEDLQYREYLKMKRNAENISNTSQKDINLKGIITPN